MRMAQLLRRGFVCLELEVPEIEPPEDDLHRKRWVRENKEIVLTELVRLLDERGRVGNKSQLFHDLWNREKKASTALGDGIAIPHVRTMKVREPALGFARSTRGVEFGAPNGQPVHLFFLIVGPPYDDRVYLRVYRAIGELLQSEEVRERLMSATTEGEIYHVLSG
jgi:mannitol/fructose-specific phosphotransferase system IIA component (Ntr-type)